MATRLPSCRQRLRQQRRRERAPEAHERPRPDFEADPVWSPDGQQIAFTRWGDSSSDIYVMNADGARQRLLTRNPTDFHTTELAWSPRGNEIAFVSRRGGNLESTS